MQKKQAFFRDFYVAICLVFFLLANPGDHDFFL